MDKKPFLILINLFLTNYLFAAEISEADKKKLEATVVVTEGALEKTLTPLHKAVLAEDALEVKKIIESGANVNETDIQGRTPLFIAAAEGLIKLIPELLNAKGVEIDKPDKDGLTPLAVAITSNNLDAIKALFDKCDLVDLNKSKCPNIHAQDIKKLTPLTRAIRSNNIEVVKLLIEKDSNYKDPIDLYESVLKNVGKDDKFSAIRKLLSVKLENLNNMRKIASFKPIRIYYGGEDYHIKILLRQ